MSGSAAETTFSRNEIESRLLSLEQSVQSLANSVNNFLHDAPVVSASNDAVADPAPSDRNLVTFKKRPIPGLNFGLSRANATGASNDATADAPRSGARETAYSELQELSTATKLTTGVKTTATKNLGFYIPSKSVGYWMISKFFEEAASGETFFRSPPDDLVRQVIFQPHLVREKAWIVSVNYMLLSAFTVEGDKFSLVDKLRRNTQLALNDSNIYLEPSIANIQALALLALHGEDYAAPNLSWLLLGHACRQAEAVGLHGPVAHDESKQQELCLFWLLFVADKSCALSFGRPAFLPTAVYSTVPVPDNNFLMTFNPHETKAAEIVDSVPCSAFGAHLFSTSIELAKLTGSVLDTSVTKGPSDAKRALRPGLEQWYENTNKVLTEDFNAGCAGSGEKQRQEMSLGITSLRFQYLHILVILLKGDDDSAALRLQSSREALSLLPSMVSNWSSVYNGVVWHLLYYPFVPFFVVFEALLQHPGRLTPPAERDLRLLSTTVEYFKNMEMQVNVLAVVCARLQHIARTFVELAHAHIDKETRESFSRRAIQHKPTEQQASIQPPASSSETLFRSNRGADNFIDVAAQQSAIDPDINRFLDWLPADMDALWSTLDDGQLLSAGSILDQGDNPFRDNSSKTRAGLDGTFDWFSWDSYYKSAQ